MTTPTNTKTVKITGRYDTFEQGNGKKVRYANISLPFVTFDNATQVYVFNADKNSGEQRTLVDNHARKLSKAYAEGNLTPTTFSVGLHENHKENLKFNEADSTFELEVSLDNPLPVTDGQHRKKGIKNFFTSQQELNEDFDADIFNRLAIPVLLNFDGDTRTDFANLQKSLNVKKHHVLSMEVKNGNAGEFIESAWKVIKSLSKKQRGEGSLDSPFENIVSFDTRTNLGIAVDTLCKANASDLSTSCVGLAKIDGLFGRMSIKNMDLSFRQVYTVLLEEQPELVVAEKVLGTITNGGKKGSATMLFAPVIAYHWRKNKELDGVAEIEKQDEIQGLLLSRLKDSCQATLDELVDGNMTTSRKRELANKFAVEFFADFEPTCDEDRLYDGIPQSMLEVTSYSAWGLTKPKKSK